MKKVIKVFVILGLFGIDRAMQAQEAIPCSGGDAVGTGGSSGYTVGQVTYTANSGTSGSVAQGVQQPFEIYVVLGIEQAKNINLSWSAYPNPAANKLILKADGNIQTKCFAFLYDMNGVLLESMEIKSGETAISLENHLPAVYFLKVAETNHSASKGESALNSSQLQIIKTFKIIKKP